MQRLPEALQQFRVRDTSQSLIIAAVVVVCGDSVCGQGRACSMLTQLASRGLLQQERLQSLRPPQEVSPRSFLPLSSIRLTRGYPRADEHVTCAVL